jgi:hypothetical protein
MSENRENSHGGRNVPKILWDCGLVKHVSTLEWLGVFTLHSMRFMIVLRSFIARTCQNLSFR